MSAYKSFQIKKTLHAICCNNKNDKFKTSSRQFSFILILFPNKT